MKKRVLSAMLCLALLLTLLPGTALAVTAGPFEVTGSTSSNDYEYSLDPVYGGMVLTVKTGTLLTIGMATPGAGTTTNDARIAIADNITANITLNSVKIGWGNVGPRNALALGTDSTLILTIEGNNSLEGSDDACGIRVPTGATLIISGSGTLSATGTGRGAGDVPVGGFVTKPGYFGMTDVRTLSGKLYFYLPVGTTISAVQTGGTSPQTYQSATAIQTNASGTAAGTLTLPAAPTVDPPDTTPNRTVTVAIGNTAGLSVAATGTGPLAYQWQMSTDGGQSFSPIGGATGANYTTSPVTMTNNGYRYYCIVTNGVGRAQSCTFVLNVVEQGTGGGDGGDANVPKTGDGSLPGLWLGILLMAGAGFTGSAALRRRKRKTENG